MNLSTLKAIPLLGVLLWGAAPGIAHAGHPFNTDDPGTLGSRNAEIELSLGGGRGAYCDWAGHLGGALAVHVGVVETVDVGVGVAYEGMGREEGGLAWGAAAPAFDVKWRFLEQRGARPGLALRLDWEAPLHDHEGYGGHGLGLHLVGSHEAGPWFTAVNVGALAAGLGSGTSEPAFVGTAALLRAVGPSLMLGVEVSGEGLSSLDALQGQTALLWAPDPASVVSLGAGPTWIPGEPMGWSATLGFTFSFAGVDA